MRMPAKFAAVFVAIAAIVALPAAAHAVAANLTTVAVTIDDTVPTSMAQNDVVDVVTHGPIAQFGSSQHILYTSWSPQSLQLQGSGEFDPQNNPNGFTYPEGWTLEYSTDGTNWSATVPGDLTTVIAVRAKGDVSTRG